MNEIISKNENTMDYAIIEDKGDNIGLILWVGINKAKAIEVYIAYKQDFKKKVILVEIMADEVIAN